MFSRVLTHEIRNILREKMYLFFLIYPVVLLALSLWLVPYLRVNVNDLSANIFIMMLILMTSFIYGAITGFTLLDDQDDHVLFALRVTPVKLNYYVTIKLLVSYLFGFIATLIVLMITNFLNAQLIDLLLIAILSSLQAPLIALIVNAFASNKVEGFVVMKGSGLILLVPIAALFINHWTETLLGIVPGFWVAKMISIILIPNDYLFNIYGYFGFGITINLFYIYVLYKIYLNRITRN
ncbi:Fluoroquinolones export permease protein Rv2686c/MT2760 [Acholeplasma oculi]|uniref:Uncharacterized protein n=1 Tax=Acholeplasma oculi TaxID=35623 RepID=A0A061AAM0_9MOLU|nr:hypothetical protein [Acholeplasma oculi]CDR30888.1 hypothetical protein Aocu_08150 [Acholeplasma oculi]SKC35427.1 fluoroquinolone transport system permease protein [Acholeplasma oculi]SUT90049.1 Fluoroquinolones export permease protein Rv2686c/MT2760 [Acholeplasma oculi]